MFLSGEFKEPALPEADITAFARDVQTDPGYLITAMWTGQNQVCTSPPSYNECSPDIHIENGVDVVPAGLSRRAQDLAQAYRRRRPAERRDERRRVGWRALLRCVAHFVVLV